jgi:hypothetical protein
MRVGADFKPAPAALGAMKDFTFSTFDDLVKSPKKRPSGESRGPEFIEISGFRLPPE